MFLTASGQFCVRKHLSPATPTVSSSVCSGFIKIKSLQVPAACGERSVTFSEEPDAPVMSARCSAPGPLDQSLWRAVQEDQLGVELLLQLQLTCLSHLHRRHMASLIRPDRPVQQTWSMQWAEPGPCSGRSLVPGRCRCRASGCGRRTEAPRT